MERRITQLEEGEKAREKTGYVNCISTNTHHAGWQTLNDKLVQRKVEMKAEEDKGKE